MKFLPAIKFPLCHDDGRSRRLAAAGFTLVELMIASAIFIFIVSAMVCIQIFGLRVYTLAATKLMATTSGRETLNSMRDQIRSSQQVYVGSFTNATFQQASGQQIGNALQIFTSTNAASTNYVIIYDDPSTNEIFSFSSTSPGNLDVLAQYQTNYNCFQAEDYQGNILTNYLNNPVIRVTMSFSQWEYPVGFVGGVGVNAYDYYYLRTRVTRRTKSQQ
jgi:Tfp pilus assembly protein PilV